MRLISIVAVDAPEPSYMHDGSALFITLYLYYFSDVISTLKSSRSVRYFNIEMIPIAQPIRKRPLFKIFENPAHLIEQTSND